MRIHAVNPTGRSVVRRTESRLSGTGNPDKRAVRDNGRRQYGGGEIEDPCKEALENGAPTSKAAVGGMITGQLHGKQGECGSAKTIGSEEACGLHGTHAGCGAAIKEVRMRAKAVDGEPERAEN